MEQDIKTMAILMKTVQAVESITKKNLAAYGLNITEFSTLEALYFKGRLPVQGICSNVLIANSSMTYVLDKLEKRGWISRTRDQHDKRTYYVDLTKEGRSFIEDILPKHIHLMHQILSVLTLDEQKTVNELLKKLGYHAKSLEG